MMAFGSHLCADNNVYFAIAANRLSESPAWTVSLERTAICASGKRRLSSSKAQHLVQPRASCLFAHTPTGSDYRLANTTEMTLIRPVLVTRTIILMTGESHHKSYRLLSARSPACSKTTATVRWPNRVVTASSSSDDNHFPALVGQAQIDQVDFRQARLAIATGHLPLVPVW